MDPETPITSLPPGANDRQLVEHYQELRNLAKRLMLGEKRGHSLAATDLAHDAWLRLVGQEKLRMLAPDEFRRRATLVMRYLLIDRARARAVRERGRRMLELSLDAIDLATTGRFDDLLDIDEALEKLATRDPALAELVRLRFFAGLTIEEAAEVLGQSTRTVNRDWNYARALLVQILKGGE